MTRLACLALVPLLAGLLLLSCHAPATTAQAATIDDCGCDPGVIVKPVPVTRAVDPIDGLSKDELRRCLEEAIGQLKAEKDGDDVHIEMPSEGISNPELVELEATWTGCFNEQENRLPEPKTTQLGLPPTGGAFSGTLSLDGTGAPCDRIEGTIVAKVPRRLETLRFDKADGPGSTKTVDGLTVSATEMGRSVRLVFKGKNRPFMVISYGANNAPKQKIGYSFGWHGASGEYASSFKEPIERIDVVFAADVMEFSMPVSVATTEQTDFDLWIRPGPPKLPIAREPGAVEAAAEVALEYNDRIHRLHLILPGGVDPGFLDVEVLKFDGVDTAGNRLQAIGLDVSGQESMTIQWMACPAGSEKMMELVKQKEAEDLDRVKIQTLMDADQSDCRTDSKIQYLRGQLFVRYPISFTQLIFPAEGGACTGVRVKREEEHVRIEIDRSLLYSPPVIQSTYRMNEDAMVVFLTENGDIVDPFSRSYSGWNQCQSVSFEMMRGFHQVVVYRINAWEEFIVPFEFGDVPEGRE
jgi:hypothetical protein